MNCKKAQEFIITDYIDGQMGPKQKGVIDRHLAQCSSCAGYLINIKQEVVNPFVKVSQDVPDQVLWARIKQAIGEEQDQALAVSLRPNLWERIKSCVHIPRPTFALATFVTMIFMVGSMGQLFLNNPVVKINGQDQAQYLSSLIDEPLDMASDNGNDSQTPIEKVFL